MIKYAYNVPLYNKKYKEFGIHLNDIKGIDDINKLPFITKDDLREYFPNGITPKRFNKEHGFRVSTSGSTGKPVFIYNDIFSSIKSLEGFARALKAYGGNWSKSKIILVIDTTPGSIEHAIFSSSMASFLRKFNSLKNIKYLNIGERPEALIKEINEFKPEFLGSDPNMLRKLAFLKNNGYGESIKLKYILSGGAMLDNYTRKYIENAFDTRLLDSYGTTEGGPLAFECLEGHYYHVNSDFVYLEILDRENNPVPLGKPGHLVVTKLYGGGTPIIRYTGLEDIVIPIEKKTSCGIITQMIKQIEGRSTDLIILPEGKMMSPLTVTGIPAKVMEDFKTYKIKQFQIIQHKLDEIEVLVVIDDKLRNVGVTIKELLDELERRFSNKIGHGVNIIVNESNEIQKDARSDYIKVVISKVKQNSRSIM
jgi:phenylacetate-CoA ligase